MVKSYTELPLELTIKIADHLEFDEDLKNFGQVCSLWMRAMKLSARYTASCNAPWLMMPLDFPMKFDRMIHWQYTNLRVGWIYDRRSTRNVDLLSFPVETDYKRQHWGSSRGWLVEVDDSAGRKVVSLLHPFSGEVIRIPDLPTKISMREICPSIQCVDRCYYDEAKFSLSGCPVTSTYYTLAVALHKVCSSIQDLCFWNSKNKEWVVFINPPYVRYVHDISFYKGQFYIMVWLDKIVVANEFGTGMRTVSLESTLEWGLSDNGQMYLVESAGVLLQVVQYFNKFLNPETKRSEYSSSFRVFELDADNWQAKEVKSLGNRALFLSFYSSFSREASYCCKPNCIYFVNTIFGEGEIDMSVYDLSRGQLIEDHFNPSGLMDSWVGSFWVEPPSIKTILLNQLHVTYRGQNSAYYKYLNNMRGSVRFVLKYAFKLLVFFYHIYLHLKTKGKQLLKEWKLKRL